MNGALSTLYLGWIGGAHHRELMRDGAASHPPATATAARTRRRLLLLGAAARAVRPVALVLVRKLLAASAAAALMLGSAAVAKADTVTDWNATFLDAAAAAKLGGPESARIGAIVQAAVYDAVNGVGRRYTPYRVDRAAPSSTSADAAAAGAAYTALIALIPSQRTLFDQRLNATLAGLATASGTLTRPVAQGLEWGRTVAKGMLAWRVRDRIRTKEGEYVVKAVPGGWQPTSPTPGPPVDRQFATLTPFALTSPSQFTPPAPPSVAGHTYALDQAEVQALGGARSGERTPRETRIALFWHADMPVAVWNHAADGLIVTERTSLPDSARLLALLNIALADTTIGIRNAQSADDFWRPVTAIAATANAAWTPLLPSPDVQEYPSTDAALANAAATVLASLYGDRTSFVVTSAGAVRRFTSFSSAVRQVEASEIYAGIDFRFSCQAGARLGDLVARYSVSTLMRSTRRCPPFYLRPTSSRAASRGDAAGGDVSATERLVASLWQVQPWTSGRPHPASVTRDSADRGSMTVCPRQSRSSRACHAGGRGFESRRSR